MRSRIMIGMFVLMAVVGATVVATTGDGVAPSKQWAAVNFINAVKVDGETLMGPYLIVLVVGLLLVPNASGFNRSIVLAAPAAICLRRVPNAILVPLTILVAVVTALLSRYFFDGRMI